MLPSMTLIKSYKLNVMFSITEFGTKLLAADPEFVEGGSYLRFFLDLLTIF